MGGSGAEDLAAAFNRNAEAKGWPMRADPTLSCEAKSAVSALAIWRSQARGRAMPSKADMTPRVLKAVLTEVALFDVVREDGRLRFRSRLTGGEIARVFGQGNGRFLDEHVPQPFLDRWEALLKFALDAEGPVRTASRIEFKSQTWLSVECLIAPLGDNPAAPDTIILVAHVAPAKAGANADIGNQRPDARKASVF